MGDKKIKVLYVDDEPNNLFGFKAAFRFDYQIFIAENTTVATDILKDNPDIQVIFCDQRMPDKTGVEFFDEIRLVYPHPIRILLTAYTDLEALIDAINLGNIFRYIKKPWTEADIISAISEASRYYMTSSILSIRNEELRKAYVELDKFAYSVTHDIRGPLSGILGAINIARDIDDLTELREIMQLMEKSVKKLDDFILSMHDYYSIQRGELKIEEIDFKHIVDDLQDMNKMYSNSHDILFKTHITQLQTFRSHELSVKLILNNLLSNAFKYQNPDTSEKVVELDIDVKKGQATITIRDNGIGILPEHLHEIFNLFFRATSHGTGSGFGLYNVKNAIAKLNGKIEVDSEISKGTVFKVVIPDK
ncbi:MAG: hybrid sensor histidine kinase/response regulator [Mucilaginibacter polytrichastri]|nr:hybrid sensor histidine kinase/response regulator [Mucilaginibacter polytrichastri]